MSTVGKILNGIWYVLVILIVISISVGVITQKPTLISYATSESMEPTIGVNDYFFIIPKNITSISVNDIVVFQSKNQGYLVHRIVAENPNGFVTQGDNSPFPDQNTGEPLVTSGQILGKVLTIQEKPVVIHGLWKYTRHFDAFSRVIHRHTTVVVGVIVGLGGVTLFLDRKKPSKKVKRYKKPVRAKHVLIPVLALMFLISMLFMFLAQEKVTYDYKITYTQFTGFQTALPGSNFEVIVELVNFSPIPHYAFITSKNMVTHPHQAATYVKPNERKQMPIWFTADQTLGNASEQIFINRYLPLLPPRFLSRLHAISPYAPIVVIDLEILGVISLLAWLANPDQVILRKEKSLGGVL